MKYNHKTSPKAKHLEIFFIIPSILLLTSGCIIGPSTESLTENNETPFPESKPPNNEEPSEEKKVIASSTTTSTPLGPKLQLDIYALESVGNGLLRLRLGITNNSGENFLLYSGLSDKENLHSANEITLIDAENKTRHLSYNQSNGSCFCSSTNGTVGSGETLDLWVIYPEPPEGVESMNVVTPMTPPIFNVPISESPDILESTGLAKPEITSLTMISDDLEDQTGRTESSNEVSIILSSDVLFEPNSSDLSPKSQEILEQVATEINSASGTVVNIDGYADNTGNDSINIPLSQDRAEKVESALIRLINRNEVAFEVEGHGSADPIADNDTEEGRERNRRVSVTFEK